jgi:hypothetical protein
LNPLRIETAKGFDYIVPANPTINVNPKGLHVTWLNSVTGELFVCIDNAAGANVWAGQRGTAVPAI